MNRTEPMLPEADIRGTPQKLFDELNERFHFDLDVCAHPQNAKCPNFYTEQGFYRNRLWECPPGETRADLGIHGLSGSWKGARVWCNPPYSDIEAWVMKAWCSGAELVVMLVPSTRTEQRWWQEWVEPFRDGRDRGSDNPQLTVEFLRGRPKFTTLDGEVVKGKDGRPSSPKFGVCLLVFRKVC